MKAALVRATLAAIALGASTSAPGGGATAQPNPVVVLGAGDIAPVLAQYRKLIGEPNNNNDPGPKTTGRREINWDGIADDKAAPAFLPSDVFKARGAILTTPGKGIQASAAPGNAAGVAANFGNLNPSYTKIFKPFSGGRLFSPIGSNIVDLTFVVPGTNTPATVRGFGAVYVDVDLPHTAFEYFDRRGKSLGRFSVPIANEGFSFLGVVFDKPVVARVRIEYGSAALGPDDGPNNDVSVMDDFIYGEPQAAGAWKPKRK